MCKKVGNFWYFNGIRKVLGSQWEFNERFVGNKGLSVGLEHKIKLKCEYRKVCGNTKQWSERQVKHTPGQILVYVNINIDGF